MKFIGLDNSMATSVRRRIKLEGSEGTSPQINTISVLTTGGQQVKPVQLTSVVRRY